MMSASPCHHLHSPATVLSGTPRTMVPSRAPDDLAFSACKSIHASAPALLDVRQTTLKVFPLSLLQEYCIDDLSNSYGFKRRSFHRDRRFCHLQRCRPTRQFCVCPKSRRPRWPALISTRDHRPLIKEPSHAGGKLVARRDKTRRTCSSMDEGRQTRHAKVHGRGMETGAKRTNCILLTFPQTASFCLSLLLSQSAHDGPLRIHPSVLFGKEVVLHRLTS